MGVERDKTIAELVQDRDAFERAIGRMLWAGCVA
jgi:hypothetical protein